MFCPNCGKQMNGYEEFCPECGTNIIKLTPQKKNNYHNNKIYNVHKRINETMKLIHKKYKKQLVISGLSIVVLCITLILYGYLLGFEKFCWSKEYKDLSLKYVNQANIKLGIEFSNKKENNKIKYQTTCGKLKKNGLEITWNLTEETGKCEITASYKLRKIKKEYIVIPLNEDKEKNMFLDYEIDENSDEDSDYDGLTNKQEKEYETNPLLSDSDMDGLNDYDEVFTYKTNPNKKDTDNDGISDYDEIKLNLNPLKEDSFDDGIKDGKRNLTYNYTSDKINLTIKGQGNIASTAIEVTPNTKISNKKGFINNLYTFYTKGTINEAIVTIVYTEEELKEFELNEDNLTLYYYDEKEGTYEKIDTIVDKQQKTVTATLKHFSNYTIGDSSLVKETNNNKTQVLFILDNSWSMYTNEQYIKIYEKTTGKKISDKEKINLDGFDKHGIRFTLTDNLITRLSEKKFEIGLSEFRRDYANILKIGSTEKSLKEKLKTMNGTFKTKTAGTNINNALIKGIKEFNNEGENKYIVILTDGQDEELQKNTKKIIKSAIEANVKICSVGFGGSSYNTELSNISNGTGCKFYSSSNAKGLEELFENIGAELDDNLIDIDGDNEIDGTLVADSGFVVNRDGFSFVNYPSNLTNGHCYGMAVFAQLYYKKVLPLKMPSKTVKKDTTYAYDLNDTYFENYPNLYDYKLKTNALKYLFGFKIFEEENPSDLVKIENDIKKFNNTYREQIENSKLYDINIIDATSSKKEQQKRYGTTYSTQEKIVFNEDKMQKSSEIDNVEKQLFNAIYTGFLKQLVTTHYSSSMDFILWLRNVWGSEIIDYDGKQGFIYILKTRLKDQDAPVIMSIYDGGLHAINAISLVQDIENPNYYYIGVYDNNYPGEKRYVDIECNEKSCVTRPNKFYPETNNEPIRITPSLEHDLDYYK